MSYKSIDSLEENPKEIFIKVTSILMKLVENVLKNPTEPKYRKIRLENATISKFVLPSVGGMECLFDMGFIEGDDSLVLPGNVSLEKLKQFLEALVSKKNKVLNDGEIKSNLPAESCSRVNLASTSVSNQNSKQQTREVEPNKQINRPIVPSLNQMQKFLLDMETRSDSVCQYEDSELQLKALSCIPLSKIESNVMKQMREIQKSALKDGSLSDMCEASINEIVYLKELMKWFKMEFFKWVDSPPCSSCCSSTQFHSYSTNQNELKYTNRVEVYVCRNCNKRELFPRYNDVRLLLDSRRGRCGEWGQCFTLFCRALKWDARFVSDNTDHVWTEVYSQFQKKWLHCDPCECVVDKPLLYEKGWNKKLDYIIAFSCDGVYDVTWRYSADHNGLCIRRNIVSEIALMEQMMKLTEKRRQGLSQNRIKYLNQRHVKELVDFLLPAKENPEETLQGRTSGSLAWRLARGEISSDDSSSTPYVWKPSSGEVLTKKMVMNYCSAKDEYTNGSGDVILSQWKKGTFEVKNMFRKEELDWKNVYLCRTEGSSIGHITWKFDFESSGMVVNSVNVKCSVTTFKNASVKLVLCGADNCILVSQGNDDFTTHELKGETNITLKAELTGGEGDVAWQHAQLFRKPIDCTSESYPLSITITLKNK